MGDTLDQETRKEVIALLRCGKKIDATKLVRAKLGSGMAEGKILVDEVLMSGEWKKLE